MLKVPDAVRLDHQMAVARLPAFVDRRVLMPTRDAPYARMNGSQTDEKPIRGVWVAEGSGTDRRTP